jgi:hypothetical protein
VQAVGFSEYSASTAFIRLIQIPSLMELLANPLPESGGFIKYAFCQCVALFVLLTGHRPSPV